MPVSTQKAFFKARLKNIKATATKTDLYRPLARTEQRVVDEGYVTRTHLIAIALAARQGRFIISIRNTGVQALSWLERGAATKPHSILEKTLKSERVPLAYRPAVESSGLQGLAARWEGDKPIGVFITRHAAEDWHHCERPTIEKDNHNNFYIPINFLDAQDPNLTALKEIKDWSKQVITGDYDTHDMIAMTGSGGPHSVASATAEELFVRLAINTAVSAIDGEHADQEHRVVQHGPQANYPAFAMQKEGLRDQLISAVARPSLPLAFCDPFGQWTIVETQAELEAYYAAHNVRIKETWKSANPLVQFSPLENGKVGLRRASDEICAHARAIALKKASENRRRRYSAK